MEYRLKINEETLPVEVENDEEEKFTAVIGKNAFDVSYTTVNDHCIHLSVNGQGVNVYVSDQGDGKIIAIKGKSYFVQDADLLEQNKTRKKGPGSDLTEVTPPMPAVVIAVAVGEGDVVEKGQAVVIVSAMKMETTLVAPFNGTVQKVNVAEGDKVMPGDILVDIEKNEPEEEILS
ncbi:MAG: biotin/lipoyl-binding protein [Desulfobacteraceae bacterium]|nr:biotin/lipoyl-binding protein [Desulfobacteraceae bacterium]MBC2756965.1 biotin/lipoyl-binding protein [Desulfobacteraceae bacterium]